MHRIGVFHFCRIYAKPAMSAPPRAMLVNRVPRYIGRANKMPPPSRARSPALPRPSRSARTTLNQPDLIAGIARREVGRALADLGLDDAKARDDVAALRAALAGGRRLRFGLVQAVLGWIVQGLMLAAALGILLASRG